MLLNLKSVILVVSSILVQTPLLIYEKHLFILTCSFPILLVFKTIARVGAFISKALI